VMKYSAPAAGAVSFGGTGPAERRSAGVVDEQGGVGEAWGRRWAMWRLMWRSPPPSDPSVRTAKRALRRRLA
jgi:hypothetical protein